MSYLTLSVEAHDQFRRNFVSEEEELVDSFTMDFFRDLKVMRYPLAESTSFEETDSSQWYGYHNCPSLLYFRTGRRG